VLRPISNTYDIGTHEKVELRIERVHFSTIVYGAMGLGPV
jgi:hypothetical protein